MFEEVKNIVLDFNGVISKANKGDVVKNLSFNDVCDLVKYSFSFLTKSGFRKEVLESYKNLKVGTTTCKSIFDLFDSTYPYNSDAIENFVDNYVDSMRTREGLVRLVDFLRFNGFKVFVLSNSIPKTEKLIHDEAFKKHFDGVYCSSEQGLAKPNLAVFDDACKMWGISPEETLFVDDNKQNVKGALKSGFYDAACLTREEDIIEFISEYTIY